jgi:endonuclease YncB( thermonuclease family)
MTRRALGTVLLTLTVFAGTAQARWTRYEGRHNADKSFDGDSFHIQTRRADYVFRLYFVDAPETEMDFPDRVREQAAYWGITEEQVLAVGREARRFTEGFLRPGVTAWTKRQDAQGQGKKRYYAQVKVQDVDLAVELVRQGFARIYGMGVELPDGTSERSHWAALRRAETEAQKAGRGAWKHTAGKSGLFRTQRGAAGESEKEKP